MRKAVRLAAPAALAAAALVLTGCSSDSDSDSGNDAKGSGSQEETTTGGDDATDDEAAGDDAPAGDVPSDADLKGWWSADMTSDEANTLIFSDSDATMAVPINETEADLCSGTVADGKVTLECLLGSEFTEGTLTLNGSELNVAWAGGTTETYTKIPGLDDFDMGDMGDLGDLGDLGEIDLDFDF
ncbi:hypothetical protein [Streptomyces carpaticus]|uniref:hypothetical protein n=1 Tax=Streptomyces carpaticus TaxID=285558 RepID=UPI0031F8A7F2